MKKPQRKTVKRIVTGSAIVLATALGLAIYVSLMREVGENDQREGRQVRAVRTAKNARPAAVLGFVTPDKRWQNTWPRERVVGPRYLGKRRRGNVVHRILILMDGGKSYTLKESLPILQEQLQSKDPKELIGTLHYIGMWSSRLQGHEVVEKLLDLFDHEKDRLVRRNMLGTLLKIGDRRALPLYKVIAKKRDSDLQVIALMAWFYHEPDIAVPKLLDFMIETQNRRDYFNAYDHLCRVTAEAFDKKRELFNFEQPRSVKRKHAENWKKRLRGYWTNLDVTLEGDD